MGGDCTNETTPIKFINFVPALLEVEWTATFLGPSSPPPRPAYVQGIAVGVAVSHVTAQLRRASSESLSRSNRASLADMCCADVPYELF